MAEGSTPVEVFCCYAREDEVWRQKLETHLSLLRRQNLISFWCDRLIVAGTDWVRAIDTHLETASVILLFVSANFFASDYCYGIEMKRALERQEAGEARVIPILVRPVDWKDAPFAHLQALPTDTKPIVSWQNKDTALADVAAGIRRVIVEELPQLSASAPRVALPRIWHIPYPRNPFFLGREGELAQIRQRLQAGQAMALSQPQAISGLGGIGKTQLALEYAYRYHQDYKAVLWARAESRAALVSSFIELATLLQLPEREAKEQDITVQAVKTWLQTHRDWLLVLDNADELALLPDFLPPGLGGHLLLTTRASATKRLAYRLEIRSLQSEQGALFLLRRAGFLAPDATLEQASSHEQDLALQISRELGGLPLALDQAGAYLEETGTDMADYWQIYQHHQSDLLQQRGGLVADHPAPVATTWFLSFHRVKELNPAAADLLHLCAFLSPDTIAEEILTTGASVLGPVLASVTRDTFQLNQAIEALRAYSLVQRDPREKTLSIHRLVQAVLQNTLEEAERRTWAERAVLAVNAAFPPDIDHDTWLRCERLLTQAFAAANVIDRYRVISQEAGDLLYKTAIYLLSRARYFEAEPFYLQALRIQEQALGSEHFEVVRSLNSLANLYTVQGKYAEAEPISQQVLHIQERVGPENTDMAAALNNLAVLYYVQGKYAEAEPFYLRALRIQEQALGPEHSEVARSLNNLALLYTEQGKYAEAEPLYLRALHLREQALGPEHFNVASPLYNLADCYTMQGKYAEAEPLYLRALRIWEQALGPEHSEVAYPLHGLAGLYTEQGKYAEAEPLYLRGLRIWEQTLGSEHPHVARLLNGLAHLYIVQSRYAEAEPLYLRALRIWEQAPELEHPDMADTICGLAQLREAQGNSEEAKDWYARALTTYEQGIGAQHPKTTETRIRFIALLHAMGLHEEAAQLEKIQSES